MLKVVCAGQILLRNSNLNGGLEVLLLADQELHNVRVLVDGCAVFLNVGLLVAAVAFSSRRSVRIHSRDVILRHFRRHL